MSREQDNKAVVGRWFEGFWGNPWNPKIIDELAAPDILLQYSLHEPRRRLLPLVPVPQQVDSAALSSTPLRLPVLIIPF